ncbi:MAG: AbrB/MazE/SpoVT family DNA-binding domain-containing protein [Armatimonadota bacterium]
MKAIIGKNGRIVIPAAFRRALELDEGDEVILRLERDELRLLTARSGLRRAQELVSRYAPKRRSLAAELIAERRRESKRE